MRFTRPVVVDPETGADLHIVAKVGAVDDEAARIDLTVTYAETTVLGKAQVRVATRLMPMPDDRADPAGAG